MTERKYIIVSVLGHAVPILFSSLISHNHFLACFCKELIVSAGFFGLHSHQADYDYHFVSIWGGSISLNLKSQPEDVKIIEKFLNA